MMKSGFSILFVLCLFVFSCGDDDKSPSAPQESDNEVAASDPPPAEETPAPPSTEETPAPPSSDGGGTGGVSTPVGETLSVDIGGATMEFVWIEPGTFTMGSPTSEFDRDFDEAQHEVTISKGFYLGKYEITQGQWEAVMGTKPWLGRDNVQDDPSHPAVYISWDDLQPFIQRLNEAAGGILYRLPTEAEWKYAARAGTTTRWSFGNDEDQLEDYAWYRTNAWEVGLQWGQPVGTKLPNPWGLYDMHGNVWEWVQDWYASDTYNRGPVTDPTGPSTGSRRVLLGGDFGFPAEDLRSAKRSRFFSSAGRYNFGARLLRTQFVGETPVPPPAEETPVPPPAEETPAPPSSDGGGTGGVSTPVGETLSVDISDLQIEFVWIEPGTFTMGSPTSESGRGFDEAQHEVTISKGFYLGKYEITQGQWEAVMGTKPWLGQDNVQDDPSHPAVLISWADLQTFIQRLNEATGGDLYRLPTEAEWEYAARAGTTTRWSFGDNETQLGNYAWYRTNAWEAGLQWGQPVGTKLPNPWGLYDMHGNVWEWVQDWYGAYSSSVVTDPTGPSTGSDRAMRGGNFINPAGTLRSAQRVGFSPFFSFVGIGARLLRTE